MLAFLLWFKSWL